MSIGYVEVVFQNVTSVDNEMQKPAFWDVIGSLDITLDVTMVMLPYLLLHNVQMPWSKKVRVLTAFAARIM